MTRCPLSSVAALCTWVLGSLAAFPLAAQQTEGHRWDDIPPITKGTNPGREVKPAEAPSTITLIKGDDLEDLGVRFLSDSFRRVPGMETLRISSTESNVSLRGYNDDTSSAQGILGLLDGRQVYNDFFGSVVWESVPVNIDQIERIEVLRGPGSFVHGPNAMHGLVNIVTRSPLDYDCDEIYLSGSAGSYHSVASSATYVKRDADTGFKASLGWDDINDFEPSHGNNKDKGFLEVRVEHAFEKDHRVGLTAGADQQKFNVLIPTFAGLPATLFANEVAERFLKGNWTLGPLKAQAYWTHFEGASVPNQFYTEFDTLLDTADADVQYSLALESQTLTAGTGAHFSAFETDNQDVSDGRHKTALEWLFLQDDIVVFRDALWVTAGVRGDHHSLAGGTWSPRLAVVWQVEKENYLRASAGSGYRNPSLREFWFDMPINVPGLPGPVIVEGNKDLEAERMRSFELGYSGRPVDRVRAEANVFYNLVDGLVDFQPAAYFAPPFNTVPSRLRPENNEDEVAYGVESEVDYLLADWLSAFGNYAFTLRYNRDTHDRNPGAPRHKANLGTRVTLKDEGLSGQLWVSFFDDTRYFDPTGNTIVGEVDEYWLLNGRVAWRLPIEKVRGHAFLQAFNLLDHDHREHPEGQSYGAIVMAGVDLAW